MNKSIILALATAASALATAAAAVAEELGGACTGKPESPAPDPLPQASTTGDEAPKRRGRPPTGGAAAEPPATPAPAASAATGGKTYEELRDLIKPLVEEGRGEEVKKVIAKYGTSLKEIPADKHAAFEKDISALSY